MINNIKYFCFGHSVTKCYRVQNVTDAKLGIQNDCHLQFGQSSKWYSIGKSYIGISSNPGIQKGCDSIVEIRFIRSWMKGCESYDYSTFCVFKAKRKIAKLSYKWRNCNYLTLFPSVTRSVSLLLDLWQKDKWSAFWLPSNEIWLNLAKNTDPSRC